MTTYIYIYIEIHIYIYVYIYTRAIHTNIHIFEYVWWRPPTPDLLIAFLVVLRCTMHTYIYEIYLYVYIPLCIYILYVIIYIHVHVYMHIYIYSRCFPQRSTSQNRVWQWTRSLRMLGTICKEFHDGIHSLQEHVLLLSVILSRWFTSCQTIFSLLDLWNINRFSGFGNRSVGSILSPKKKFIFQIGEVTSASCGKWILPISDFWICLYNLKSRRIAVLQVFNIRYLLLSCIKLQVTRGY